MSAWSAHSKAVQGAVTVARFMLGALFAYAAVSKLPDLAGFAEDVANYRVLPAEWVAPVTVVVIGIELAAGALLMIGIWVRAAAVVTAGLLAVFTVAIGQALGRGVNLNCGCFGTATPEPASIWTVFRDGALFAVACGVAWFEGD